MFDILVAGEINPDLILTGDVVPSFDQVEKLVDSAALTVGSSSAIFACGAARLGLKVAFMGRCGNDIFGKFMLEEMAKRNIDLSNIMIDEKEPTGLSVILNRDADRAILTHLGLIPALRAEDIQENLLRQTRHLHVASYFLQKALQPGLPGLFKMAQSLGLTTSLDTNYDPTEKWSHFDDLLKVTNVFMPNEKEACSLAGNTNIDQAADLLSEKVNTLVVKMGASGSMGVQDGQKMKVPSNPVNVVDTVGAGDSFDAGFLCGYLMGWPLEKSLRAANLCGAFSTQAAGGINAQPTLEEVLREIS